MDKDNPISVSYIKSLAIEKNDQNLDYLLTLFQKDLPVYIKREVVSSIGRQNNDKKIYKFILEEAFNQNNPMELVYQMYRTCLYRSNNPSFSLLGEKILKHYDNEVLNKMKRYYKYKHCYHPRVKLKNRIDKPKLLIGDSAETLSELQEQSIQLIFTSPPYYNARAYSDYHSYKEYLKKIKDVFVACNRVLEDGRFIIVNISPVITKRPGREFESIRYPIHFDFHKILEESGYYFVDEIIWIKPEVCVPNRIGGYLQTRKPLTYKPNCITESLLVYRKNCDFLLDKNVNDYGSDYDKFLGEKVDTTNCWYITPKSDKNHPAVFPEELCKRVLKYYSFKGDSILDPFAGSGTLGRVARAMGRTPVMCEISEEYANIIENERKEYYDISRRSGKKDR